MIDTTAVRTVLFARQADTTTVLTKKLLFSLALVMAL